MRIGLDARFLTHPQVGGFKTYTRNLVRALAQVDGENEYIVYVDREPIATHVLPAYPNFRYVVVPGTWPGVGVPFREQVLLRRRAAADELDLMHFLCNTATIGLCARSVITLHDTIQVTRREPAVSTGITGAAWKWVQSAYSGFTIRCTTRSADHVIAVSHYEKDRINAALGIPAERISVTHEAPEPEFSPCSPEHLERTRESAWETFGVRPPYVLGVGYEPRKNIELLIEAFAALARDYTNLQVVVVAAEEGRRLHFVSLAESLGVRGRTTVLGGVAPVDLAALYRLAEVFVFPSSREGFGLPPLEAMACGAPTIAMRGSSIPEIVGDGAFLVDGIDLTAWTDALRKVLGSPSLRAELSARGLQRAAAFSWARCARQTVDVYRGLHAKRAV